VPAIFHGINEVVLTGVRRKVETVNFDFIAYNFQKLPTRTRSIVATVLFGLGAGLIAVLFQKAINAIYRHGILALSHESTFDFLVGSFLLVAATSAFSGWLLTQFCGDAAGSGIPQTKLAFLKNFGVIPWRVVWVKFIGGALSVGGGSSLGREGPSVQLGSGVASGIAGTLGIPKHMHRVANASGAAAGLAAAFNTPIAAVTFALEEIIGDLNSRMLGSVLLASVLGALVAHGLIGSQPSFLLHSPGVPNWLGYALTPFIAAAAAVAGGWFQKAALGLRLANKKPSRLSPWLKVLIGGLLTWALGVSVFLWTGHLGVFSLGYDDLSSALDGGIVWHLAILLLVAKLLATSLCYGFGGCGGIFAPSLFFGGMVGTALSGLAGLVLPLTLADHVTLAVVGMCACLGAVVRAPVTGILIVFEMTHEFALVPALAIGALVSQWISRQINKRNFYDEVLAQDGQQVERIAPPRSLRSWMEMPVARIACFTPTIAHSLDPAELRALLAKSTNERFPVLLNGTLSGILSRKAASAALESNTAPALEAAVSCTLETSLREIQSKLVESSGQLAVVFDRTGGQGCIVGVLTLHDILRAEMLFAQQQEE
jgi:CIC family chloride channel protein